MDEFEDKNIGRFTSAKSFDFISGEIDAHDVMASPATKEEIAEAEEFMKEMEELFR